MTLQRSDPPAAAAALLVYRCQGQEVQITEEMIQQACSEMEQRLAKPAQQG